MGWWFQIGTTECCISQSHKKKKTNYRIKEHVHDEIKQHVYDQQKDCHKHPRGVAQRKGAERSITSVCKSCGFNPVCYLECISSTNVYVKKEGVRSTYGSILLRL